MKYFRYGKKETGYLKNKDEQLGQAIDEIGKIKREVDDDLFVSIIHHIIGQQISTKAQNTIFKRLNILIPNLNYKNILAISDDELQAIGITYKKVSYIKDFAIKVQNKEIDLNSLYKKTDEECIKELSSLRGIGIWTAEMILLFCMQRPNILSYDDLAIQRGLRMLYHHRKITKKLFIKYQKRYSPYCSVASLYLWAIASGAIPEMRDYKINK